MVIKSGFWSISPLQTSTACVNLLCQLAPFGEVAFFDQLSLQVSDFLVMATLFEKKFPPKYKRQLNNRARGVTTISLRKLTMVIRIFTFLKHLANDRRCCIIYFMIL